MDRDYVLKATSKDILAHSAPLYMYVVLVTLVVLRSGHLEPFGAIWSYLVPFGAMLELF